MPYSVHGYLDERKRVLKRKSNKQDLDEQLTCGCMLLIAVIIIDLAIYGAMIQHHYTQIAQMYIR